MQPAPPMPLAPPPPQKPAHPAVAPLDLSRIAQDLQIRKIQVEAVVQLLDEGNTVPFITRYRKERTGGLDEELIRIIQGRVQSQRQLNDRKHTILKSIENQERLTDELRDAILAADSPKRLEDLYLPFKPKKRSLATMARERGLETMAHAVWTRDPVVANLPEFAATMVNPEKELNTPEDVLAGVGHIIAEGIAESADIRSAVRHVLWESGKITTTKSEKLAEHQGREYKGYFQFTEAVKHIPPHRILAINRGEKENALVVKLEFDGPGVERAAGEKLPFGDHPHGDFLRQVAADALNRLLLPSLENEIRKELRMRAEGHAVTVFARNLRSLLLGPPLRGKRVLAIDPGMRTGCKLAALDEHGNLLEDAVIYPHQPQNRKPDARRRLEELIRRHESSIIAIGNGTGCRETEELVSELIADIEKRRQQGTADGPIPGSEPVAAPTPPPPAPTEAVTPPTESPPTSPSESATSPEPQASHAPGDTEPASVESAAPVAQPPAESSPALAPVTPPPPAPPLPAAPADLAYVIVNEAGASVYSASPVGREEFPNFDATTRGTISIGRRLQDPLSELVKVDPQSIGVGLYQHDVNPRQLKESLEDVVESCVNQVGIDLNTASVPLLRYVSGMNQLVARQVVEFRSQHGPFRSREQLLQVPNLGEKRYEQAAGFLKIPGGDEPLDLTWIHPESYPLARQILTDLGYGPDSLRDREKTHELQENLKAISPEEIATRLQVGAPTVADIMEALARPGRDPREDLPPPIFKKGVLKIEDLQSGMELAGTVLNVVDFGAFVDIGLKDTGLVHISQMANRYVKSPYDVVSVGDIVTVWVLKVDRDEHKVGLSMIRPGTERSRPPERGDRRDSPPRREGQVPREGQGQGQGPREGQRDQGPPRGGAPGGGQGQFQGRGGPPRGRFGDRRGGPPGQQQPAGAEAGAGGPPPRGDYRRGGPPRGRGPGGPPSAQQPPPPRKPSRPAPKPKLSQDQLKGSASLRTFSELAAFIESRDTTEVPATPAATPPVAETPVPPPAEAVEPPPSPPPPVEEAAPPQE